MRTQDIDITSPTEGDVYTILKYLAVVTPRPGARPQGPDETSPFQIVLSPNPERMTSLGWGVGGQAARMLGPDAFETTPA
jgi:hypothetical protein